MRKLLVAALLLGTPAAAQDVEDGEGPNLEITVEGKAKR